MQQLSIFSVLQQIADIELIERNLARLNVGEIISTFTCDIERSEKLFTVRSVEFEETFQTSAAAFNYIKNYFENGITQ